MKRLILAATVISASLLPFTCSANADSLGINKDCDNHPVSQYGMDTITAFSQYKTESKKFKDALTAFCNKGKTMGDMGFEAANAHSLAEARKWTDSSLPGGNEEQKKFSAAMGSLLHYAMLNGFSGFDYPRPPEQKEKPVSSFNPNEICDDISSKAAKYSTSNLPPQVQISLAEWNQIKGEFQMVCFAGIMAGNNRQSVDSKILAGMNDIGKEVYLSAYRSGSEYPKPRSKNNTEKNDAAARKKEAVKEKADAAGKQSAANKTKQADDYKSRSVRLDSPDFQRFQSSLRNEFMRRIGDAKRFSGKECSINVWMSQKGEVLSARKESGDEELCSVVLQASKGMRLSPMSNEVYGVFHNPSLNFKF